MYVMLARRGGFQTGISQRMTWIKLLAERALWQSQGELQVFQKAACKFTTLYTLLVYNINLGCKAAMK